MIKILPVVDNFERGLAAVYRRKIDADDAFMRRAWIMILQAVPMTILLGDAGVKAIEAAGRGI